MKHSFFVFRKCIVIFIAFATLFFSLFILLYSALADKNLSEHLMPIRATFIKTISDVDRTSLVTFTIDDLTYTTQATGFTFTGLKRGDIVEVTCDPYNYNYIVSKDILVTCFKIKSVIMITVSIFAIIILGELLRYRYIHYEFDKERKAKKDRIH